MTGSERRLSWETSVREGASPQSAAQASPTGKAAGANGGVRVSRKSDEGRDSITRPEQRGDTYVHEDRCGEGRGDGWLSRQNWLYQIVTPPKVQKLQRTLYRKAKAQPDYRFWSLYGDICRADVIETAMRAVAANDGGPGLDGLSIRTLAEDTTKWEQFKNCLLEELRTKQYRPQPVLRHWIRKDNSGKMRPLGIPTVRDRVVQAAAVIVLLPIFEADMHSRSYGYRPGRNAHQAIREIKAGVQRGRWEVIDADLSGYFDSIPHGKLLRLVARRVSDGSILALIKAWLRAPVVERNDRNGTTKIQPNKQGTPQGGVISPLLANLYLNRLDHEVNGAAEQPWLIRYADDFVILCGKGHSTELLERLKRWLSARGLTLNETKTRVVDVRKESIKFLGFGLSWRKSRNTGRTYLHIEPHGQSVQKLRDKVKEKLNHWTTWRSSEEVVAELNRLLTGWTCYFREGNPSDVFGSVQWYIRQKLQRWLWHKHGRSRPLSRYDWVSLHHRYGLKQIA